MAFGNEGQIGVSRQNSWGTGTGSYFWLPFVSEGLAHTIESLAGASIMARYDEPALQEGMTSVAGDMELEVDPVNIGPILRGAFGLYTSSEQVSGKVWQHQFRPAVTRFDGNCGLTPYTVQVYRGVGSAFIYTDCQFNTLEFNISAGQVVKAKTGVIGRSVDFQAKSTPNYLTEDAQWAWFATSASVGSVGVNYLENVTITLNNNLQGIGFLDGTRTHGRIQRTGFREVRISGTVDLPDLAQYMAFKSRTEQPFNLTLTGESAISSGYYNMMYIQIPKMRYEAFPVAISGPNRLTVGFTGRCAYSSTVSYSIQVTVTNTYAGSYY